MRVLLVEDDAVTVDVVQQALVDQHYLVDVAADGQTGWELAEAVPYDLILLDLMLPRMDGICFCQRLRTGGSQLGQTPNRHTPMLLMTSQTASTAKVAALDAGADDYLVKPFDLNELLARVRALLRRGGITRSPLLVWGNVQLDPGLCEVIVAGQPIHLSSKEYSLLELLLRSPKRIFSNSYLIEQLWAEDVPTENAVRAQIKGLRKKLKEAGTTEVIETVYGLGYRLREIQESNETQVRTNHQAASTLAVPDVSPIPNKLHSQNLQTTTQSLFAKHRDSYCKRLAVIEQAIVALRQQTLSEELRQQACREAHTLKGSLGLFEMDEASQLSREVEHLLQDIPTEKQLQPLEHRAAKLKQLLASAHPLSSSLQEENVSVYKRQSRTLWIVGNDLALLDGFMQAAATHSLQVEVFSTISELRECHSQSSPDAILLVLACTETDDIILHSLSDHYPKVPLFVVTASPDTPSSENLQQRSKAVQLGAKGFWQGEIVPDAILQTIVQSLQPVVKTTARILVVDDDLALLEALQIILHPWGFELTLLNHPQQFWGTLEQVQPDLVILDVEMPEVSGIELCQVVRHDEQWGDLPILFLSAHTDDATLHKIFTVGADDYVSKPVRAVELVSRVLRRLEQARLLKHLRQLRTL